VGGHRDEEEDEIVVLVAMLTPFIPSTSWDSGARQGSTDLDSIASAPFAAEVGRGKVDDDDKDDDGAKVGCLGGEEESGGERPNMRSAWDVLFIALSEIFFSSSSGSSSIAIEGRSSLIWAVDVVDEEEEEEVALIMFCNVLLATWF